MLNTTKETAYFEVIQEGLGRLKVLELLDMDDDLSLDSVSKPTVVESPLAQRKLGSMDMLSSGSGAMKATLPPSSSVFTDSAPSHLKKNNRMSIQVSSVRAQDEEQQQTPSQATSKRDKRQSNIFSLVGLGSALSNSPTPMSEAEMKLEGLLPSNNNAASLSNASSSAANKRSNRQSSMFALGSGPVVVPHQDALQEFSSTTRGSVMMIESSLVSPPTSKRDKRQSTLFGLGGSSNNLSSSMPSLKKSVPDLQISSLSAHNSESVRKAVEEQVERLREAAVSAATPMLTESVQALCSPMVRDFPRLLRSSLSPVMESLVLSG